jgi:hypothetical protein
MRLVASVVLALVVLDVSLVVVVVPLILVAGLVLVVFVGLILVVAGLVLVVFVGLILVVAGLVFIAGIRSASISSIRVAAQLLAAVTDSLAVLGVAVPAVVSAVGVRAVVSMTARQSRAWEGQDRRDRKRQNADQSCSLHRLPFGSLSSSPVDAA